MTTGSREIPASELKVGDWVTFEARGEKKVAHVDQVWEEDGKINFVVETTSGGFMDRRSDPDDLICVLYGPPDGYLGD
jgi:hypothetical protein